MFLLNYLQLITLTSSFNLNWPTYMLHLVKAQQTVGNVSDQVFSIDCFFENNTPEDQDIAVRSRNSTLYVLQLKVLSNYYNNDDVCKSKALKYTYSG